MLDAVSTSEAERERILGSGYNVLQNWMAASLANLPAPRQKRSIELIDLSPLLSPLDRRAKRRKIVYDFKSASGHNPKATTRR